MYVQAPPLQGVSRPWPGHLCGGTPRMAWAHPRKDSSHMLAF